MKINRVQWVAFPVLFALFALLAAAGCQSLPFSPKAQVQAPPQAEPLTNQSGQVTPAAPAAAPGSVQVLGTFSAPDQATLTYKISGIITDLPVQEGATVKKGDTLAVLDTTELQLNVQQAQAALAGAQARLSQAKSPSTNADAAAAQASMDAALKSYEKVRQGPSPDDLAPLKAGVDNAKAALDQAQSAYDKAGGASNPYSGMLPQSLQLQTATNNYTAAVAAYNDAKTHPTAAELAGAWGQVQQAQAALARLQPTSDNIAAAQAAVDQAQAALALAQRQVTNATLVAPFDGTVITRMPHVGEMVGPTSPIVVLADLAHLQFQANVDQILLGRLSVGQFVSIVPDAFPGKTVSGKIARIGWSAAPVGSVIGVPVTIDVEPSDLPLRPGLSAAAQIQTQAPGQ